MEDSSLWILRQLILLIMDKDIDVFISYSRKDYVDERQIPIEGNIISVLRELFSSNGISFWLDEDGIYSGDAFAQVLARNIKRCKILLFVSSKNSNSSAWTCNEIATAVEYKKLIIPFRIDDSVYHEDVVLYVAKLDYIAYYANKEKALQRLVDSILAYKDKLEKQRLAIQKKQEEMERQKREEEERKNQELRRLQKQREEARLAEIALQKKRREEELNSVVNQIFELEKNITELANRRDEAEREIKNIDREISLIQKQQQNLENKQKILENQLSSKSILPETKDNNSPAKDSPNQTDSIVDNGKEPNGDKPLDLTIVTEDIRKFRLGFNWRWLLGWAVLPLMLLTSYVAINFLREGKVVQESVPLQIVPVETDSVFGIETIDTIDWNNLYVHFPDQDNSLHKVSFALLKATSGKNDAFLNAKYNREKASKCGIKLAFYHLLNTKASWKYATGRRQAENYIRNIGKLGPNDLPPVLSIPQIDKEDADVVKARCLEWLHLVHQEYGMKPIVYVGQSIYEDYVSHWGLDNVLWMPTVTAGDSEGLVFQKLHYRKTLLYNGDIPQEKSAKIGRLSKFLGTYEEFTTMFGFQSDNDSLRIKR